MKKFLSVLAVSSIAAIVTPAATAAVFDFTTIEPTPGGAALGTTASFTEDGITIDASFFNVSGATNGYIGGFGLGVEPGNNSVGLNESITIDFGPKIRLNSVTYNELPDRPGSVDIGVAVNGGAPSTTAVSVSLTQLFGSLVDTITFSNLEPTAGGPFFRIAEIDVSQVPLPGAAILFGSAMAAAGAARRFKKKAAAA